MKKPIRIPCDECLTISVCRHKTFNQLLNDCSPIHEYLKVNPMSTDPSDTLYDQKIRIVNLSKILKATQWELKGALIYEDKDTPWDGRPGRERKSSL